MKYVYLLVALLGVLPGRATTITDVTTETTVVVRTGDTLSFEILAGSFARAAVAFGLEASPTQVGFALVSAPVGKGGSISASLASFSSADGAVSVELTMAPQFAEGWFASSAYQGPVSLLAGYVLLSAGTSQALFGTGSASLALRNDGPGITLGLAPYLLRQDIFVSLGGGPLSVGGRIGTVELRAADGAGKEITNFESFDSAAGPIGSAASGELASTIPEPDSAVLFLGGGCLLCGASVIIRRFSRGGR